MMVITILAGLGIAVFLGLLLAAIVALGLIAMVIDFWGRL